MNICGFIFARGGSKGCPGKNIRPLGGKPLIAWAIEAALSTRNLDRVIVSTDDPQIASVALAYGAEVPYMRPLELASDNAPEWLAWRHAVQQYDHASLNGPLDVLVSVPAVAPFRIAADIDRCIDRLVGDAHRPDVVFTVTDPESNPYFSMVVLDENGVAKLAAVPPGGAVSRRQDAPAVFNITPVAYAVRTNLILAAEKMMDGVIQTVHVPRSRALDIDTEDDFLRAQYLWATGNRAAA